MNAPFLGDIRERTLDAVKIFSMMPGPERGGERRAGAFDGLTHPAGRWCSPYTWMVVRASLTLMTSPMRPAFPTYTISAIAERAGILHRDDRPVDRINYIFHRLCS